MKMLLATTPYRNFDEPPRIISEIKKKCSIGGAPLNTFKPKLTGDLLVKCGNETKWWPRRVSIRNGQMHISRCRTDDSSTTTIRLPLRHFSLKQGALANSISLYRGQNVILTLQASNEQLFDLWVRVIAIELIRQTPLEAVKYLDILTLVNCWKRKEPNDYKDCNFNYVDSVATMPPPPPPDCQACNSTMRPGTDTVDNASLTEEKTVEILLRKCQNSQSYVPVKEKLMLFESLCKLGRKVRSTEDVSSGKGAAECTTKRTRSMYDLSCIATTGHKAVREICEYFEFKNEANICKYGTIVRNNCKNRSDSQLNK